MLGDDVSCSTMLTIKEIFKGYCKNSTLTGVHYITDEDTHWTEKVFWTAMIASCWYGSSILILAAWNSFVDNPISFGVETNYIEWETNFPAVAVCEHNNLQRVYDISDDIWTPDHPLDLEEVLKELAYFRGISLYTIQLCHNKVVDPLCPLNNFTYYANLVRSDCKATISNCTYNNKAFECCEYFQQINTDVGKCYIINSIQVENASRLHMISNRETKLGTLKTVVLVPSRLYTLGQEEVPGLTTLMSSTVSISRGEAYRRHIAVRNIENDPLASETSPSQRACRYWWEQDADNPYPYYSYSTCVVRCRKQAQLAICNCTDHFMPGASEEEICDISGLACLNEYYNDLSVLRPQWANRHGLVCDCVPSCVETDISVVQNVQNWIRSSTSTVEIHLEHLPTERFKRNVVRSRLDLVVSIGGTAGLLLGASLLSFVELIAYFTLRYCGSIYLEMNRIREAKSMGHQSRLEMNY